MNVIVLFSLTGVIPNVHDVLMLLGDVSARWNEIGLALAVSSNDLEKIQQGCDSAEVKISKVITTWQNTKSSSFTWDVLISAIEGSIVKNKAKADEIRKYLHC